MKLKLVDVFDDYLLFIDDSTKITYKVDKNIEPVEVNLLNNFLYILKKNGQYTILSI